MRRAAVGSSHESCRMKRAMKAMVLTGHGGLDKYEWREDWPRPEPGPMEALNQGRRLRAQQHGRQHPHRLVLPDGDGGDDRRRPCRGRRGGPDLGRTAPSGFRGSRGRTRWARWSRVGAGADPALLSRRVMIDGWQRDWSDPENLDKARYFGSGDRRGLRRVHQVRRAQRGGRRLRADGRRARDLLLLLHDGGGHAEPRERERRRHRARPRGLGRRGGARWSSSPGAAAHG